MRNLYLRLLIGLILTTLSNLSYAGTFACFANHSGYCSYHGHVSRVYVNRGNILLIYTDAPMDISKASVAGDKFSKVTQKAAFAVNMNTHYEFGKNIQALALSALMGNKKVSVQMRDTYATYLQIDRLWIFKD